ncbi:MAG: DUF6851 domain-containing protein [Planctomycetota bacterium]
MAGLQPIRLLIASTLVLGTGLFTSMAHGQSVARQWNDALLEAIRIDFPAPTVHARNLYHTSAGMYDAWSTFDPIAQGHFVTEKNFNTDIVSARNEAVSYAAYRILSARYQLAVDPVGSQNIFDSLMNDLGYDKNVVATTGNSPAAIGNRIAEQILGSTLNDGSNEANNYVDNTGYEPINRAMVVDFPGVVTSDTTLDDPNRWQPLFLESARTQNGLVVGDSLQTYIGPHWGDVTTFAMNSTGPNSWSDVDPGAPPLLNGVGDAEYRSDTRLLIDYSNSLDPSKGAGAEIINISPNTSGNRPLGTHDDQGYSVNPVTGQPYADNFVKTADYGRVLAEFWADGPRSETPPGHWNVLANEVADNPQFAKRIGGTGPIVEDLEWDVKMYLGLNGATHDAAVAAWGTKREYDYVRPITKIRYQGSLGQSSDANLPSFHPDGLELEDGIIELITAESIAEGGRHRNALINANQNIPADDDDPYTEADLIGKVAIMSWNHEPADPANEVSGTHWILAENWVPYQEDNFVTPAFAAYVSGHSTFSRAAAEVLAEMTGSEYFPGGLGEQEFTPEFLDFEDGPSEAITLQWATYYDAADEAGISRLWGGIHVPVDDFAGREMGSQIGQDAVALAISKFVADDLGWHNKVLESDVNFDNTVSPLDALLAINELGNRAFSDATTGQLDEFDDLPPGGFLDVNDDGFLSPLDALLIINDLPDTSSVPPFAPSSFGVDISPASVPEPAAGSMMMILLGAFLLLARTTGRSRG